MSTDVTSEPAYTRETDNLPRRDRRVLLPVVLLLATCLSTFWTGAAAWKPLAHLSMAYRVFAANLPQGSPWQALREALAVTPLDWRQGLLYMALVLGILLTHEMGHFLMSVRYQIPASLPYFIPLPMVPFGTLGAVIGMEGSLASRRQMFDLGVAGPLAGLAVALPIAWIGILWLPAVPPPGDSLCFHNPADLPMADRLDSTRLSDAESLVSQPIQRIPDGKLDGHARYRPEHAARQPV